MKALRFVPFSCWIVLFLICVGTTQAQTSISGSQSGVWNTGGSPYLIIGNVSVPAGQTLTIQPGVIVKFNSGTQLVVDGTLLCEGTSGGTIVFTSYRDDSAGGSTDDETASAGVAGDWKTVQINPGAKAVFKECRFQYGGASAAPAVYSGGALTMENCQIQYSAGKGVQLAGDVVKTLQAVVCSDSAGAGFELSGTNASLYQCVSERNGAGLVMSGSNSCTECAFNNNTGEGIRISGGVLDQPVCADCQCMGNGSGVAVNPELLPTIQRLTISGNVWQTVTLPGGTLKKDVNFKDIFLTEDYDLIYILQGNLAVDSTVTWTINAGAMFKLPNNGVITVNGSLFVFGEGDHPVVFTSYRDDRTGGDTNGDGPTTGAPGDWGTVIVSDTGKAFMEYARFQYGGNANQSSLRSTGELTLNNCLFQYSKTNGAYLTGRQVNREFLAFGVQNCQFINNTVYGLYSEGTGSIQGCLFQSNTNAAVNIQGGQVDTVTFRGSTILNNGSIGVIQPHLLAGVSENTVDPTTNERLDIPSGTIKRDTTFDMSGVQYNLAEGGITIDNLAKLTIQPGVIFKADAARTQPVLTVNGSLEIVGTGAQPVVFTSYRDDTYVGDTNGDGPSEGAPGDWNSLHISESGSAVIRDCLFRYGGYNNNRSLILQGGTLTANQLTIERSAGSGALLNGSSVSLTDTTIRNCGAHGIELDSPAFQLTGCYFQSNKGNGLSANGSGTITGCVFNRNTQAGLIETGATTASITCTGSQFDGNGVIASIQPHLLYGFSGNTVNVGTNQFFQIPSGVISRDTKLDIPGALYDLANGGLTIQAGAVLQVDPGVFFKPAAARSNQLIVQGKLEAIGTAELPIIFTSYRDDEFGGDSNGDGPSTGAPGDWGSILVANTGDAVLTHCVIRYGGVNNQIALTANGSLTLKQTIIDQALSTSVSVNNSTAVFENSTFQLAGLHGASVTSPNFTITNCVFASNNGAGLNANGSGSITDCAFHNNIAEALVVTGGQTDFISCSGGMFTGNGRIASIQPHLLYGFGANQVDTSTNVFFSIPSGVINHDTQLAIAGAMYDLADGGVTVAENATLRIDPGVIFKSNSARTNQLIVQGKLEVNGTSANPVVFTSYKDDATGGDTNQDGPSTGQPGDWGMISIAASGSAAFNHCVLRYGAANTFSSILEANGAVTLDQTTIEKSRSMGLMVNQAAALLKNSVIQECGSTGAKIAGPNFSIQGCEFIANNGSGMDANGSGTITNNTFQGNTGNAVVLSGAQTDTILCANNAIAGNGGAASVQPNLLPGFMDNQIDIETNSVISVPKGSLVRDATLAVTGAYYDISEGGITIEQYASLTAMPGIFFKALSARANTGNLLVVNGKLFVQGTDATPVVFTSYRDDESGGDTNKDGVSKGVPGDWGKINIAASGEASIEYADIRFGASGALSSKGKLTIQHSTIESNGGVGMLLEGASLAQFCSIQNNAGVGIQASGSNAVVRGCDIEGNGSGVSGGSQNSIIEAEYNYWGSPSGPLDESDDRQNGGDYNPSGAGDSVSNNVDYRPWLFSSYRNAVAGFAAVLIEAPRDVKANAQYLAKVYVKTDSFALGSYDLTIGAYPKNMVEIDRIIPSNTAEFGAPNLAQISTSLDSITVNDSQTSGTDSPKGKIHLFTIVFTPIAIGNFSFEIDNAELRTLDFKLLLPSAESVNLRVSDIGILGDANGNGLFDAGDALAIAQYVNGLRPTLPGKEAADINQNGHIDLDDALLIAQIIAKQRPHPMGSYAALESYVPPANTRKLAPFAATGLELQVVKEPAYLGDQLVLDLFIQSGNQTLGAYDLALEYDARVFMAAQVSQGGDSYFGISPIVNMDHTNGITYIVDYQAASFTEPVGRIHIGRIAFVLLDLPSIGITEITVRPGRPQDVNFIPIDLREVTISVPFDVNQFPATPTPPPSADATPTPTLPAGALPDIEPVLTYEFSQDSLAANGWSEIPGGFNSMPPGVAAISDIPSGMIPTSVDGRGLEITVDPGELVFLHSNAPIQAAQGPLLIDLVVRASGSGGQVALVALKGSLATYQDLDGSIATLIPINSVSFANWPKRLFLVYEPDTGALVNPAIQVYSVSPDASTTVWIDRMNVYAIDLSIPYMNELFNSSAN